MKEMEERERKTQELLRSKEHSVQVRKKAIRGAWNVAGKQAMAQNIAMEKVQQFGAAFEMIQQATGRYEALGQNQLQKEILDTPEMKNLRLR